MSNQTLIRLFAFPLLALALAGPTLAQCPPAATGLGVTTSGCANTLTWTYSTSVSSFQILRGSGPNFALATTVGNALGTARSFTDSAPPPGTALRYWLRPMTIPTGSCATGEGALAGPVFAADTGLPAPTNPFVNSQCGSVALLWDIVPGATSYHVIFDTPGGAVVKDHITTARYSFWNDQFTAPPTRVRIFPINACGEGSPLTVALNISPIAFAPSNVSASEGQTCQVLVQWTPDSHHLGTYRIDRSGPSPSQDASFTAGAGTTSYADTTAVPGIAYQYAVHAVTACDDRYETPDYGSCIAPMPIAPIAHARAALGATAVLSSPGAPTGPNIAYAWRRGVNPDGSGGTLLSSSGRITGATSPMLTITALQAADNDLYALDSIRPCGTQSVVAALVITNLSGGLGCRADFDNSGHLEVADIFAFLTAWFAGCP